MSTLLAGRWALYSCRQSVKIFTTSRLLQHSFAASTRIKHIKPDDTSINVIPTFRRAGQFGESIAIHDVYGDYTYKGIFRSSRQLASDITNIFRGRRNERVAFLCPNNASYVITQWACWMSGQIAVPMSNLHPQSVLEHYVNDSRAKLLITTAEYVEVMRGVAEKTGQKLLIVEDMLRKVAMKPEVVPIIDDSPVVEAVEDVESFEGGQEPEFYTDSDAMIIYTSGTTGAPKGVVLTHLNLVAQAQCMLQAWEWTPKDIILHALPLHHMHGITNALIVPLTAGARCVMLEKFDAAQVWSSLLAVKTKQADRPNIFMGVPAMYGLLIQEYDKIFANNPRMKEYVHAVCSEKIRLMTSGSARLPPSVNDRWFDITGQRILERYGMTETGMILSNPLHGERRPGFVGNPMPTVEVRIAERKPNDCYDILVKGTSAGTTVLAEKGKPTEGDLHVKGPSVFREYYKRPKVTRAEFTPDGWFKTGDTVQYVDGSYQLLGRTSVDIIKTGGFKVSALEIEAKLLLHPDIADVAVLGIPDITWGQKVGAVVILHEGKEMTLTQLRDWSKDHLAAYCVPTVLKVVDKFSQNAMGKINKKKLLKDLFPEAQEVEVFE